MEQGGSSRLSRDFFERPTLEVARELIGKRLIRRENGRRVGGRIIETEAYVGTEDLGCHARSGRTRRNAVMWGRAGHAYVYFNYGMHWLLNFVTEDVGFPAAVLIRGIAPEEGIETIFARRAGRPRSQLTNGPAKLCLALDIDGSQNGLDLCTPSSSLRVEEAPPVPPEKIEQTARIGLNSVPEPWKSIPWRYRWTSD